jgi:hypothetical protein
MYREILYAGLIILGITTVANALFIGMAIWL